MASRFALALVAASATVAVASVNCTTTAPLSTFCCPYARSEVVKTSPPGSVVMIACAVDNKNKLWYWNYNGLYTPYTKDLTDCTVNGLPGHGLGSVPDCSNATDVLRITADGPPDRCDPRCDSNGNLPGTTYFGDKQRESNMAQNFRWMAAVPGRHGRHKRFPHAVHRLSYEEDEIEE